MPLFLAAGRTSGGGRHRSGSISPIRRGRGRRARAVVIFLAAFLGGGEGLVFRFLGGAEDEAATRGLFPDFDLAGGEDLCSH